MKSRRKYRRTHLSAANWTLLALAASFTRPSIPGNAFIVAPNLLQGGTKSETGHHGSAEAVTRRRCVSGFGEDKYVRGKGSKDDAPESDDEDVHPSAAWLYTPAMTPRSTSGVNTGGSRAGIDPLRRRTLAVDYGTYRVGLAIGVGISPRAVSGIFNRGNDLDIVRQVLVRARGEGIRDIVVGLPLVRNGTETGMCELVRTFASTLADAGAASRSPVSVFLWDERFSSAQAGALLDRHGGGMGARMEIDSLAASLILEHYFAEGGRELAERVEPRMATAEALFAAGRTGQSGDQSKDEDPFGEENRRQMLEARARSIQQAARESRDSAMRPPKSKRKRRRKR